MATIERSLQLPENLDEFFGKIAGLLAEYLKGNYDENTPVAQYLGPDELKKFFEIEIPKAGVGLDAILEDFKKTMQYSVRTGHIRFFNQLWAGSDIAAIVSEWFLSVLNTSMYTWEVAPVFTLMEMYLVDLFCKLAGYEDGEGTFAPGGAHANLLGVLAARQHHFPHTKKSGWKTEDKPICFTSKHSHYTIPRSASVLGIGTEGSVYVPVDEEGRMIPAALEEAIIKAKSENKTPFLVNATCGTTVYGAYDNVEAIADICERHNIWLHIDACWGGHCLFSSTYRHLMKGCHRANSIALTGTKCFGLPQQCAIVILKKKGMLRTCNAMNADYLFHEYEEKNYDLGDLTLNCGRRVDSFKLWVSLKVHGLNGFEERTDHAFAQGQYIVKKIKESGGVLELAHNPQSLNICFWYVPKIFRGKPRSAERDDALDKITSQIRRRIQLEGKVLTNFADVPGQPHFFRHITCNPGANSVDSDVVLAEIIRIGTEIDEIPN